MVITRRQQKLRRQIVSHLRLRFHRLKLGLYSCFVFFMCNTLLRLRLKSFLTPTSLSSEESVEKAPDHKLASKPAKTRLEPNETPKEQPPEAGFKIYFCLRCFVSLFVRVVLFFAVSLREGGWPESFFPRSLPEACRAATLDT